MWVATTSKSCEFSVVFCARRTLLNSKNRILSLMNRAASTEKVKAVQLTATNPAKIIANAVKGNVVIDVYWKQRSNSSELRVTWRWLIGFYQRKRSFITWIIDNENSKAPDFLYSWAFLSRPTAQNKQNIKNAITEVNEPYLWLSGT